MSTNDITGDKIMTKPNTKEYEENWNRVFNPEYEVYLEYLAQKDAKAPTVDLDPLDRALYHLEKTNQL